MDSLFQTEAKNLYLFLDNVSENKKDFYIFVSFNKIKIYVTMVASWGEFSSRYS